MLIAMGKHSRQRNAGSRPTGGWEHGVAREERSKYTLEPVRVAGQQDDGREAANSLTDNNKDLGIYSQCCSKPLKREF